MKKTGEKFTEKYKVESATIYKGDVEALKVPGPDHPLYDPTAPKTFDSIRVEAIDRDGKMTTPIEIWSDPDEGILWVVDGRGRLLDVREVNRRRAAEGRELVKPYIVPFNGDEKAAVARVREKNYHRRTPTPSGMAVDLAALRRAGHAWEACAKIMHVETDNAEKWGRKLLPLAFCIPEVQAAVDTGGIPRVMAAKFGGHSLDGETKLGKNEQKMLLTTMLADKEKPKAKSRQLSPKQRDRIVDTFWPDTTMRMSQTEALVAKAVIATLQRISGEANALSAWPAVEKLVEQALAPPKKDEKPSKKPVRAPKLKAV